MVIPTSYLLINFVLAKNNICYILLSVLSPSYSSSPDIIRSKFLSRESITTTIIMLSQMSLFGLMMASK